MSREIHQTLLSSLLVIRHFWQELRWGYNEAILEEQLAVAQGTISLSARKYYFESQAWEKHFSRSLKNGLLDPELIALQFPYSESIRLEREAFNNLPVDELNARIIIAARNWLKERNISIPIIFDNSD